MHCHSFSLILALFLVVSMIWMPAESHIVVTDDRNVNALEQPDRRILEDDEGEDDGDDDGDDDEEDDEIDNGSSGSSGSGSGGSGSGTFEQCGCLQLGCNSFIVTRLWRITNTADWTPEDVIEEFEEGFAEQVTSLPGFVVYTAAYTGQDDTVYFSNAFRTREQAEAAQAAAVQFVQNGDLNGNIEPLYFTEGPGAFHLTSGGCVQDSIKGAFLSTRLWRLADGATIGQQDVIDEFVRGYAPFITQADNFQGYGGHIVDDDNDDLIFFFNVFLDEAGALLANAGAAEFVQNSQVLNGQIERVVFTEGLVGFDFNPCNLP